ncbi:MAG: hypothetical protein GXZ08_09605, partial [Tissierellia bacterium]|nr:hypothetical protein [Tissierellia bacterium]
YTEYSNPRINPNLSTVQLSISPYQAGWKTYSVDVAKIQRFNFRDNSERYVIYLGKEDNFNAVNKDILDYLVENNVSVRASTKPEYVDKLVGSNEINLRQFINATPYGKLYEENKLDDILLDILKENIREDDSDGLYVIVNEDTVEYSKFYRDLEGDPKYSDKVFALHDEFYFENSMGLSDYHNKNITVSSMIFDKVGKYNIRYSAVDNPSTNNLFSNYRKESNEIDFIVYAHRRRIADFEFDLKYREKSVDIIIEDFSYDFDHESEPNKGIVKWEWFYRKNDEINWTSGKPLIANYGDYIEVYLRVTDVEGATAYAVRDILVPNEAELVLKAKARTLDGSFSITSVPASEKLELYDIWTEYPYDVSLEVAMYQGEERKTNIQRIEYSTDTGIKTENEITWNNIIHIIPATLPDGNYTLKIKAISDDGKTAELDFPVTVNTPINLVPEMPSKLITEDPTSIKGKTSKYANSLTVQLYVGHTFSTNVSLTGSQSGNIKNWIRNYTAPNTIPDGIYTARFTATTPNGNIEIKDLTYKVESLKISGYLLPNPAMAGDKIYFYITTEGYADKLEIVVPNDLIAMDKRVEMGYPAVSYPSLFFNVDKNVYKKEDILDYIVWVTTEETIDKNNVRLRQPYKFIVRAYKGEMTREIELDLDIRGSILELLKPGIKNKYGN